MKCLDDLKLLFNMDNLSDARPHEENPATIGGRLAKSMHMPLCTKKYSTKAIKTEYDSQLFVKLF